MAAAMKSPKLRAYQRTAIESARRALTKSGSCILQMPTGAGKTRAATEIVATSRGVIWFVCHRQEIERQVAKAFTAAGIDFGIVSPRGEMQPKKRVQIVSVGTLPRRIKRLPVPKLVVWDECHHVAAKSWASIRTKLKGARHLGLTATPERLDGKGLGEWFAELVTGPGISELIKRGYLSEFRYFAPSDPDLTNAKLQAGDYKKADLGRVMNTPVLIGDAVREYKKNAKGKRALAFCASVEASKALAAKFNAERIAAAHVDGATPTADRERLVEELAAGRIKVLCNVEVFTEGFDLPAIDAVILMRPTKSPTLLLQMIGRGLRKAKGKDVAIIMDHAGLHRDHAWFADDWHWSLDGGAAKARRASVARGPRRCPECKEVRFERVEVCACGYEFPTGREIGEFDGVLTEVRSAVPEGCVTREAFAQLVGAARTSVDNWVNKENMPTVRGYPVRAAALEWVEENQKLDSCAKKRSPVGFPTAVSAAEFSRETGISTNTILTSISRGMPAAPNGWPLRDKALLWLRKNHRSRIHRPFDVEDPENYVSPKSFETENGLHPGMTYILRGRGLTCASNGWVHREQGREWLSRNLVAKSAEKTETVRAFAERYKISTATITAWKKIGLPHHAASGKVYTDRAEKWVTKHKIDVVTPLPTDDEYLTTKQFAGIVGVHFSVFKNERWAELPRGPRGSIPRRRALEWVREQKFSKLPPMDVSCPDEYEPRGMFCKRIGFNDGWASVYAKRGLPCASNGWVHIQRGLEWVRDNTNIKIPASAWPKKAAKVKRKPDDDNRLAA